MQLKDTEKELDPFVEEFMLKCKVLHRNIGQQKARHLEHMTVVRNKVASEQQGMRLLQQNILDTLESVQNVQKSVFDTAF